MKKRAFLSAACSEKDLYAQLGDEYYRIIGALYGLKTSPLDYQKTAVDRLVNKMGFKRLGLCRCIFIKIDSETKHTVIVFDYVDDFLWTGSNKTTIMKYIDQFREYANTTPVIENPEKNVLGMEIKRDRQKRTISLSMIGKISELRAKVDELNLIKLYNVTLRTDPHVPVYDGHVLIHESDFENLEADGRFLQRDEILIYLSLVGGLLWHVGIRWDIVYGVLYLTWFTHQPRVHHMKVAIRAVVFLDATKEKYPLVLGGKHPIQMMTYTDATLGTGPKMKSVIAYATRLGPRAGLVMAKAKATIDVTLSSFESEAHGLDAGLSQSEQAHEILNLSGLTEAFKSSAATLNILTELRQEVTIPRGIWSDNNSMVNFVNGEAQGKGIRHALLRLWYLREQVAKGVVLKWMSGKEILANPMTKAVTREEYERHAKEVQGLLLLEDSENIATGNK
jgi:hypothetical protein